MKFSHSRGWFSSMLVSACWQSPSCSWVSFALGALPMSKLRYSVSRSVWSRDGWWWKAPRFVIILYLAAALLGMSLLWRAELRARMKLLDIEGWWRLWHWDLVALPNYDCCVTDDCCPPYAEVFLADVRMCPCMVE